MNLPTQGTKIIRGITSEKEKCIVVKHKINM